MFSETSDGEKASSEVMDDGVLDGVDNKLGW